MPDATLPVYTAHDLLTERRPASAQFIARKVLSIDWPKWGLRTPPTGSLVWLREACRAELDWCRTDWSRITGRSGLSHDSQYDGMHPADSWRLPIENLAARVLNIWGHVNVDTVAIRQAIKAARVGRERGCPAIPDISDRWEDRRKVWPLFVEAAREYRASRAEIDADAIRRAG